MESTNRTMVSEAAPQRAETSVMLPIQRLLGQLKSITNGLWPRGRGKDSVSQVQRTPAQSQGNPWFIAGFVLVLFLLIWHVSTLRPTFDSRGLNEDQLQMMEFNGDIVRLPDGSYAWNPEKEKVKGIPGPLAVVEKAREELAEAFVKKGTNDHGIAYLVLYTVSRFAGGFLAPR